MMPAEQPVVLSVTTTYAYQRNLTGLLRHVRDGGIVRLLDVHRREVVAWMVPGDQRPEALAGTPDDMPLIEAEQHRKRSAVARDWRRRKAE